MLMRLKTQTVKGVFVSLSTHLTVQVNDNLLNATLCLNYTR